MVRLLLIATLLAGCPSNWRTRDTIGEGTLLTITAVDWYQTMGIIRNCSESNPIIGECGERVNMHVYFISALIIQGIASRLMPSHWRGVLQGAWIGAETATVIDNAMP